MATWSVAGNKVTLTLDSGDSGVIQRAKTFTAADGIEASQEHTFYLEVKPSSVAVEAFLQVVGGDLTLATVAGSTQTLTARGDSNGSSEITVRFGVREAGLGGGGGGDITVTLDYPSFAAAQADGWNKEGNVNFNVPLSVHGLSPAVELTTGSVRPRLFRTFPLPVGSVYRARSWGRVVEPTSWFVSCGLRLTNETGSSVGSSNALNGNDTEDEVISGSITATGAGAVVLSFGTNGWEDYDQSFNWAQVTLEALSTVTGAEVEFDNLTFCVGSGVSETPDYPNGDPNDPNDPGDDTPPEPPPGGWPDPPVLGARTFGNHGLPAAGFGPWNNTIKRAAPRWVVNLLREAEDNDSTLMFCLGPEPSWLRNGQFYYPNWLAQLMLVYNDIPSRNAINAAFAGTAPYTKQRLLCWYVIDEPFHLSRYGTPIPYQTVENMVIATKNAFPTVTTLIRVDPTDVRYVRKMTGLNWMWAEYSLARGPIDSYLFSRYKAAEDWGHGLVTGLHYKHFEGPGRASPRYITPVELTSIGGKMVRYVGPQGSISVAMNGWKYENGLWNQSTFPERAFDLRDEYFSLSPA